VHDVVEDHALVLGGRPHRRPRRTRDVDPMQEGVAGKDHVEQVAQRPPSVFVRDDPVADDARRAAASLRRLRAQSVHLVDELFGAESGVLLDLKRGQGIDHQAATVLHPTARGQLLPHHLRNGRDHLDHAQDVSGHRTHVPCRAVRGRLPLVGRELREQLGDPLVLRGRELVGDVLVEHGPAGVLLGGAGVGLGGHGTALPSR